MPWPDVMHDFDCFTPVNPEYAPMRQLVRDLHSCAASDLHATQTTGGNLLPSHSNIGFLAGMNPKGIIYTF